MIGTLQKPVFGRLPKPNNLCGIPFPAGAWLLNENSGDVVNDISGFGNRGVFTNGDVDWKITVESCTVNFENTTADEHIDCGSSVGDTIKNKFTIDALVYWESDLSGRICARHANGDYGFQITRHATNDTIEFALSTDGANWNSGKTSNNSCLINTWYRITATYDGVNMRVYINGLENTGGDFPKPVSGNLNLSNKSFMIGYDGLSDDLNLHTTIDGQIAHVVIYDQCISASQAALLCYEPFPWLKREPIELWTAASAAVAPPLEFLFFYLGKRAHEKLCAHL